MIRRDDKKKSFFAFFFFCSSQVSTSSEIIFHLTIFLQEKRKKKFMRNIQIGSTAMEQHAKFYTLLLNEAFSSLKFLILTALKFRISMYGVWKITINEEFHVFHSGVYHWHEEFKVFHNAPLLFCDVRDTETIETRRNYVLWANRHDNQHQNDLSLSESIVEKDSVMISIIH